MGALTMEIERLNKTISNNEKELAKHQKEVEKLTKQLEKAKEEKQQKREYERDLKKAVENDLKNTFCKCFERDGLEKGYINLTLKATRDEILKNVPESVVEYDYIDSNYEKILNQVKKIYENDKKAKETMANNQLRQVLNDSDLLDVAKLVGYNPNKTYTFEQMKKFTIKAQELKFQQEQQAKEQEQQKKESNWLMVINIIGQILKWIFIILFGGIYFILKFFSDLSKNY